MIFTDASDPLSLNRLESLFSEDLKSVLAWDQQISVFQFGLSHRQDRVGRTNKEISKSLERLSFLTGGKLFFPENYEAIFHCVDYFLSSLKHKVLIRFKRLNQYIDPLVNRYFSSLNWQFEDDNKVFIMNATIKLSSAMLGSKFQIENAGLHYAKFPFPEDPINCEKSKISNNSPYKLK